MGERIWRPAAGIRISVERATRRTGRACWRGGRLELALPADLPRREEARLLELLVWGALGRALTPALEEFARCLDDEHFRRPFARAAFHRQCTRWGSCSANRRIYLSHRLLTAPGDLLRAVLLHEMAHLGCLNHGKEFWRALAAADPLCRSRRVELACYGKAWVAWWSECLRRLMRDGCAFLHPPVADRTGFPS